jgi:hypothetical protein
VQATNLDTQPTKNDVSVVQNLIEHELTAIERGEIRSESQIRTLFSLLPDASREQIARAERLQLAVLVEGRALTEMPVLGIEITTQPDGSKNIAYYENRRSERFSDEDLNPSSTNSRLFSPKTLPRHFLGSIEDARLITPTHTALRSWSNVVNAERANDLVRDGSRLTYFNGIPATWDKNVDHKAWSTNIDTVCFSDWLKSAGVLNSSVRHSLEVGSGIGGISQVILTSCQNLERHVYTDIDPNAINATRRNLRPLVGNREVAWFIGKGVEGLAPPGGFDLIVGNPPYIPHPDGDGDIDHYSGTKLIKRLFEDGIKALNPNNPNACICIQISSVTLPDFERYQREHPGVEVSLLCKPVRVPLKILGLLRDERVLHFLKEQGKLEYCPNDPLQYYHEIMAYKLTPRNKAA